MEHDPGPAGTGQGPGLAFLLRDTISLFVFCTLDLDNRIPRPTHTSNTRLPAVSAGGRVEE
jgi:hypothetical protein